jgi:predicted transposase/invertase (TIGR01784 family)
MSEYKYVVDTQSKVVQAKREGKKEGLQEGRKEGSQEARKEIALKLRKRGVAVEQIAEYTGLTLKEIEELRD